MNKPEAMREVMVGEAKSLDTGDGANARGGGGRKWRLEGEWPQALKHRCRWASHAPVTPYRVASSGDVFHFSDALDPFVIDFDENISENRETVTDIFHIFQVFPM
jgi:hypothetical protein